MSERIRVEGPNGEGITEERQLEPERVEYELMTDPLSHLSEGLSTLVRGHIQLARAELPTDAKPLAKDAAVGASGVPVLYAGYLLLWVGIGFLLALALPAWASFLIVAAVNFIIGAVMLRWAKTRAKKDKVAMPASSQEFRKDREWLQAMREIPETGHVH